MPGTLGVNTRIAKLIVKLLEIEKLTVLILIFFQINVVLFIADIPDVCNKVLHEGILQGSPKWGKENQSFLTQ